MYSSSAVLVAFSLSEIPFILLTSAVYCVLFYFLMGFAINAAKFFLYYLFIMLAISTFTFQGQMLISLLRDAPTSQALGALLLTCTSLFSGVFIRPDQIPRFWIFLYWILPGHWIFEGLFMSQFTGDDTQIEATPGSPFYVGLDCENQPSPCMGSVQDWVFINFSDWSPSSIRWDVLYLVVVIVLWRSITFVALTRLDYRAN
jgi:ABC-type multidrug transport system permease subunit